MGAGVATGPHCLEAFRRRREAPVSALERFRKRAGAGAPPLFPAPRRSPKAPAVRRWRIPKEPPDRSSRIRHRTERTVCLRIRPLPCRARQTLARLRPRRRLGRAALPSPSHAGFRGKPNVRVRMAGRERPGVAVRSVVPPGFCRGCRAARRPGFHLAAALAAASSAALALHAPPRKASRSGCGWEGIRPSPAGRFGHTAAVSGFSIRRKGKAPVDYEDNGDQTAPRTASGCAATKAGWRVASASARTRVGNGSSGISKRRAL